jgi:fermentation-respiration switch protein FrsA (DUF1100 family)
VVLKFQSLPVDGVAARVRKLIGILAGFYILLVVGVFVFQRSLFYFPSHHYITLSEASANRSFEELPVRTADGLDLKGWYAPATTKPFTFVFFHGNGDCLASASEVSDPYIAAGYGFLVAEYRGYSGLPGKPSEAGLYADGRAYIYALMGRGVKSENIILFAHSLGTGVAVQMAEEFHVSGVILLAPYSSVPEMAQIEYPYLPARYLARDRFENDKKIGHINAPVLIVNGSNDQQIPPSQGRQLYELANEPKEFHSFPGRGHNDSFSDLAPIALGWVDRLRSADQKIVDPTPSVTLESTPR